MGDVANGPCTESVHRTREKGLSCEGRRSRPCQVVPRTLPTIDTVSQNPMGTPKKGWSGEPTAVILKATKGLAQAVEAEQIGVAGTIMQLGMDEEVRRKAMELVRTRSRPWPQEPRGDQGQPGTVVGKGAEPRRRVKERQKPRANLKCPSVSYVLMC